MSKNSNDTHLLLPGESGWEIWSGHPGAGYTLAISLPTDRASEIAQLPAGDLKFFFPIKSATAVPLKVNSDEEALFEDLASLHSERLGLRPDPLAGQLTDLFIVSRAAENNLVVSVQLRAPREGELPTRGPKAFDLSARAYPVSGNTLAVWKEFGRWVFACYRDGQFAYSQATTSTAESPDDPFALEIKLALAQLALQGLEIFPNRLVVWTLNANADVTSLTRTLRLPVEIAARPAPLPPEPPSKLLPADVRAARRPARRRRNILLSSAAAAFAYLAIVGFFSYGLWQKSRETRRYQLLAEAAAPESLAYTTHVAKWQELTPAIDLVNSPVDILNRIARCIPPNSGLRLRTADINSVEIQLNGEAPQSSAVNQFSLALNKSNDLADFVWQTPEPQQSNRGWEFRFIGLSAAATETQP